MFTTVRVLCWGNFWKYDHLRELVGYSRRYFQWNASCRGVFEAIPGTSLVTPGTLSNIAMDRIS